MTCWWIGLGEIGTNCRVVFNCLLFIKIWDSVSESHILMFELWSQKSPKHTTEKRILAATVLSIILDMHSLYHCLCPVMIHIWVFFPNGDAHEQIAQPLEPRSDIDSGQNDVFFLSYCYVFFNIRVRIWVLSRFSRGTLYRKLQAKLENYLLKYSLKPLWSVQWTKPPEYLFLWWLKHGILLNLYSRKWGKEQSWTLAKDKGETEGSLIKGLNSRLRQHKKTWRRDVIK